jgi:hypothetical protein
MTVTTPCVRGERECTYVNRNRTSYMRSVHDLYVRPGDEQRSGCANFSGPPVESDSVRGMLLED